MPKEQEDEYTEQLKNQYKTDLARSEKYAHEQQGFIDHFKQSQDDIKNMQGQQPSALSAPQQMPPMAPEAKAHITQNVLGVLAIAAIAFSVFGTRRNSYSQGAMMNGLGALFSGIAKGRMEKVKEDQIKWHQLNESIQKENAARLRDYKDILANKKLGLSQQMELIRLKAEFNRDANLASKAAAGDLAKVHQNLESKEKAKQKHAQLTPKTTEEHKRWRDMVFEKSSKAGVGKLDVDTPEGYDWALHNYPLSQFKSEEKTSTTTTTTDDSGKKTTEKTGGFDLKSGTSADSSKSDYDKHMDTLFGSVPKKKDTAPDKTPDQPAKSVLSPEGDDGSGIW